MRLLIQRVTRAKVTVESSISGEIAKGMLIFLGIGEDDTDVICSEMAAKACKLRVFDDEAGKMYLDVLQISGEVLVVSQFTLYADTRKGNRPSFISAAKPEEAKRLYKKFISEIQAIIGENRVAEGVFGAMMDVELINDGPVTIWIESC